jgi:hypothetical protein
MILHTQDVSATGWYDDAALEALSGFRSGTTIACFHVDGSSWFLQDVLISSSRIESADCGRYLIIDTVMSSCPDVVSFVSLSLSAAWSSSIENSNSFIVVWSS